jgi:16S rRNA (cytidine1402-2'-O)-methyltransferase
MGELVIAAVPLGNIGDASERLREGIQKADLVLAEDSRRFFRLCRDLNLECSAKVISFFEGNELERIAEVREALARDSVLLVTDSGMPGISDPGFRVIRLAIDGAIPIRVIPGPSAVTTALVLSGLPMDRFVFEGFPERTTVGRDNQLAELATETRTIVFFEAPHRILDFLDSAIKNFGPERLGAICREMTKTYEETVRGTLTELRSWAESKEMLGEFTIVISGFSQSDISYSDSEIVDRVRHYESAGITRKEAIATVAKELKIPKRNVFDIMVANK